MEGGQGGGAEQWTTIDRKASKKKNKIEETSAPADDGWEQVNKKDRRKKDSVVDNKPRQEKDVRGGSRSGYSERGQGGGHRGRGGGGERGGRSGGENGGRGSTLPRKNSRAPRGGGRGGPAGRGGTTSPSPNNPTSAGRGNTPPIGRGMTPQPNRGTASPSPVPQVPTPVPQNTWASKILTTQAAGQTPVKPAGETLDTAQPALQEPSQQPRKFSYANITNSSQASKEASVEPIESQTDVKLVPNEVPNLGTDKVQEECTSPSVPENSSENTHETITTDDPSNIPSEEKCTINDKSLSETITNNTMQLDPDTSNNLIGEATSGKNELVEDTDKSSDVIDNGNSTVISDIAIADSNGNFAMDNNENITDLKLTKSAIDETQVEAVSAAEHKLTNGNITSDDVENSSRIPDQNTEKEPADSGAKNGLTDLPYKEDQWSPANQEGKKQYDRDFLMRLQTNPLSLQKPGTLPDNMEVILNTPALENIKSVSSAPNLNKIFDMSPQYIRPTISQHRTPRRGDSRKKDSRSVKVINLPREEVKLNEAENAWKPTPKKGGSEPIDDVELLSKKIRSILNKLCPQKFDTLVEQFASLTIDTSVKLVKAMELVFEKAIDEPAFSVAYARMAYQLMMKQVQDEGKSVNFRSLLIKRCQEEFQKDYMEDLDRKEYVANLSKATTEDEKKAITADFEAQEMKLRRRSLGNIRFIGELYKIQMLNGRIMHECIRKLLLQTDEESLECLCRLVTTVGHILEQETEAVMKTGGKPGFSNLDEYFSAMDKIIKEKKTSSRVRFLMQDVIELRLAKWVKRREEAGPKTIDQIHKEAQKEELQVKLANMTPDPPPSRRSEDRSDRRRSQMGPGRSKDNRNDRARQDQDWNNVPARAAKIQEKVDPSKLKLSKVDVNTMSFGRPGGFGNWSKGSASASQANKKMSMQEPPALKQNNRFAMFGDEDADTISMPPPVSNYHGRASEPAYRTGNYGGYSRSRDGSKDGYRGRNSRDGSYSGRQSRDGSYSGRSSRDGSYSGRASRDGGQTNVKDTINEGVTSILKGKCNEDRDMLKQKTKSILEEYFHNVDMVEAFNCIAELYHIETINLLVENMLDTVLEMKEKDRINAGKLLSYLLKNESLPRQEFTKGVNTVLEFSEDIVIDIPNFWMYVANTIGIVLVEKSVDMLFLKESSIFLLENNLAGKYLSSVLSQMAKIDQIVTAELWHKSRMSFADFKVDNISQFVKDNKLEFLDAPVVNGLSCDESKEESLSDRLDALLSKNDINILFGYFDENYPAPRDNTVIRTLVSRVIISCIDGGINTSYTLKESKLREFGVPILKKYLDAVKSLELQALYSLQALVHSLEHPNKLLHSIFDVLYDCDVISEDAFNDWEESMEPGEQEGKGVALKSCTQFFLWLKTAEPEDDDEEPQKVTFTIGDDSSKNGDSLIESDKVKEDGIGDAAVEGV